MFARSVPAWSRWVANIVHEAASKLARNRPFSGHPDSGIEVKEIRAFRTRRIRNRRRTFGTRGHPLGSGSLFGLSCVRRAGQ